MCSLVAGHDRRGQGHAVVLCPGRAEGPGPAGSRRPARPAARPPELRRSWRRSAWTSQPRSCASSASTWRYMIASARASYGARRRVAMSSGKSGGQRRSEIETIGAQRAARSSSAAEHARTTDARTVSTRAAVAATSRRRALVVDRRRRHARLDELDPAAVDDRVVGVGGHGDRPAEVIGDAQAHGGVVLGCASVRSIPRASRAGSRSWRPTRRRAGVLRRPVRVGVRVSDRDGYAVGRLGGRDVAGVGALELAVVEHVRARRRVEDGARAGDGGGRDRARRRRATRFPPGGSGSCVIRGARRSGSGRRASERGAGRQRAEHVDDELAARGRPASAVAFYRAVFGWEPEPFGPITLSARRATSAEWRGSRSRATWSPRWPHPIPTSRRTGTSTSASPTPTRSPRRRLSWAGPC